MLSALEWATFVVCKLYLLELPSKEEEREKEKSVERGMEGGRSL